MNLSTISLERLQQIQQEREETQLDPNFHSWMQQMNIGRLHVDRDGIVRANQMMQEWNNHLEFKTTK